MAKKDDKKSPNDKTPAAMGEELLIREVDEELRAERLHHWWQRFGSLLVSACVLVILATIAYQTVTSWQRSEAEQQTATLLEALRLTEKSQYDSAIQKLTPLSEESTATAELAQLSIAYIEHQKSGETTRFTPVSEEGNDPLLRDLAALQQGKFEAIPQDSAFYPLAAEQKALSLAEQGQKEEARTLLLALLDRSDIPSGQRQRLNEWMQEVR